MPVIRRSNHLAIEFPVVLSFCHKSRKTTAVSETNLPVRSRDCIPECFHLHPYTGITGSKGYQDKNNAGLCMQAKTEYDTHPKTPILTQSEPVIRIMVDVPSEIGWSRVRRNPQSNPFNIFVCLAVLLHPITTNLLSITLVITSFPI